MKYDKVDTYDRGGGRGLVDYGTPITATYGEVVHLRSSSAVDLGVVAIESRGGASYAWLDVVQPTSGAMPTTTACAHISKEHAKELVRRLLTFINED